MALAIPRPGLVLSYSYLWHREFSRGREEGVKDRPCVIVVATKKDHGQIIVRVVPISHSPPRNQVGAIEIQSATKRRLGLDDEQSWVITSEMNVFTWPGPDIRPVSGTRHDKFSHGQIPNTMLAEILERLKANHRRSNLASVPRDDD